jgi:hypothetical protein
VGSTVGRELAFLQSHGVHHFAVLALAQPHLKASWSPSLWVAESTLRAALESAAPANMGPVRVDSVPPPNLTLPLGAQ